jgi:hypothetical protein
MAFVKVVEGSEIYNFPIYRSVQFYSKVWSFACSNSGSAKRVRASRRRDVAHPRAPRRLGVWAAAPFRGCLQTEVAHLPQVPVPAMP